MAYKHSQPLCNNICYETNSKQNSKWEKHYCLPEDKLHYKPIDNPNHAAKTNIMMPPMAPYQPPNRYLDLPAHPLALPKAQRFFAGHNR